MCGRCNASVWHSCIEYDIYVRYANEQEDRVTLEKLAPAESPHIVRLAAIGGDLEDVPSGPTQRPFYSEGLCVGPCLTWPPPIAAA
jgi:hypothetical protein